MSEAPHPNAKEGIVLDREGNEIYAPAGSADSSGPRMGHGPAGGMQFRVYKGGWWLPIALGVGIPVLFVAGIFLFTVLMTVGLAFMLLRSLFSGTRRRA